MPAALEMMIASRSTDNTDIVAMTVLPDASIGSCASSAASASQHDHIECTLEDSRAGTMQRSMHGG